MDNVEKRVESLEKEVEHLKERLEKVTSAFLKHVVELDTQQDLLARQFYDKIETVHNNTVQEPPASSEKDD